MLSGDVNMYLLRSILTSPWQSTVLYAENALKTCSATFVDQGAF